MKTVINMQEDLDLDAQEFYTQPIFLVDRALIKTKEVANKQVDEERVMLSKQENNTDD